MLSLNRRSLLTYTLALPVGASLTACGFTPVYGPDGVGSALNGRVEIQAPETITNANDADGSDKVDAYYIVRHLESRLGRSGAADYRMNLELRVREEGQAITAEGDITRYSLIGEADYSLVRLSDGKVVASGTERNFTGYSASGTTVQTLASGTDAHERLMVILGDQIVTKLFATADLTS